MNESIIQKVINRSNRNLLIACVLGILAVVAASILSVRYFYNFVLGPFPASAAELASVTALDQPEQYWVEAKGEGLLNTGMQYYQTSKSGAKTIEASYFALLVGKKLLLVRMDGDRNEDNLPGQVTGWMSEISGEEATKVIQALEADEPRLKGMFLPYKLEAGSFRTNGFIGIGVGLVVLVLSAWGILTVVKRVNNPATHPVLKSLARFGPVDFVVSRIDAEMSAPHTTIGKLHLTATWLVYADQASLLATRFEDIVWYYKHVTTHRHYGIPISKTFTAMVYDTFGTKLSLVAGRKEPPCDEMLQAISQRAPWAVAGYSTDLESSWNRDRNGFLEAVGQRKRQAVTQEA